MKRLWTWENLGGIESEGTDYSVAERCIEFEKDIWFKLGKSMWKKHQSVFQYHVKYIHNDIVKPLKKKELSSTPSVSVRCTT